MIAPPQVASTLGAAVEHFAFKGHRNMQHLFWLLPGKLAGRPGPNRLPWRRDELQAAGIDAILPVNDGACCDPRECRAPGLVYRCQPMPDSEPPQPGDDLICRTQLLEAYAYTRAQNQENKAVLVHCSAGKVGSIEKASS